MVVLYWFSHTEAAAASNQERLWRETLADDDLSGTESQRDGQIPFQIDAHMMHDIQVALSQLEAKARQLLSNATTNIVERWMHIRCKLDGGKAINRSQSGFWEYRYMGLAYSKT